MGLHPTLWLPVFALALFSLGAHADIDGDGIADDVDPYPSDAANLPVERDASTWRILEIYVATLNRAVDAEGLDYWVNEVITRPQWNPLTVAQSFFSQPEVQQRYPASLGFGELIEALYQNILGRQPDPQGFDYWLGELDSGRLSRNQMVIALINGLWSNPLAYQNGDVARFRNRILVSEAFAAEQRRADLRFSALTQGQRDEFVLLATNLFNGVDQSTANTGQLIENLDLAALSWMPTSIDNAAFWTSAVAVERDGVYRRNAPSSTQLYSRPPNAANCDPGELTAWAKTQALDSLNAIRALHRLPAVTYLDEFDAEVQSGSLVQLANSGFVGHFPSPSDNCFSQLASDGARTSNLSYGSTDTNPVAQLLGWAHDANNIAELMAVGHRRHILKPDLGYTAYGATFGYAAQKVFSFGRPAINDNFTEDFLAFPFGAYPFVLAKKSQQDPTPWSVHAVAADAWDPEHDYFGGATVSITDTVTGEPVAVQNLYSDSARGYGRLHGVLSWIVPEYEYDREYDVVVSGISMPDGGIENFSYPVTLVRQEILDLEEPLESGDTRLNRGLRGTISDADDRDATTITVASGGVYRLTAETPFSNWALFVELYDDNKELLLSTDEETSIALSPGTYTLAVGRCSNQRSCYTWDTLQYTVELQ